jgi:hypothetical protein
LTRQGLQAYVPLPRSLQQRKRRKRSFKIPTVFSETPEASGPAASREGRRRTRVFRSGVAVQPLELQRKIAVRAIARTIGADEREVRLFGGRFERTNCGERGGRGPVENAASAARKNDAAPISKNGLF